MSNISNFLRMLENVHLNGIIEECVVTIQDDIASVMAMELTSSIYTQCSTEFEHEDDTIGLGDLALFIKYLRTCTATEVKMTHKDNTLTVKPKNGAMLKYLLSEPDLVVTYESEWEDEDDKIKMIKTEYEKSLRLDEGKVTEFLNLMRVFSPNSVFINIDKKGSVVIHGGNETEHQFDVTLGKLKIDPCKIKVYGDHISAVFSALDFDHKPVMCIADEQPVFIESGEASWLLSPLSDETD